MRQPLTGAALKLEQSRKKWGRLLGRASLVTAVVFFTAVLVRLVFQGSWTDLDSTIFAFIWGITACTVHLVVFIAEALSGSDSPKSVLGVVIFWFGMVVLWVM